MTDEYGPDIITLSDEDGVESEYEVLDSLDYDGRRFVALLPTEISLSGEDELFILEVKDEDGEDVLVTLEDEELYNELFDLVSQRIDESVFYGDGEEDAEEEEDDAEDEDEESPEDTEEDN